MTPGVKKRTQIFTKINAGGNKTSDQNHWRNDKSKESDEKSTLCDPLHDHIIGNLMIHKNFALTHSPWGPLPSPSSDFLFPRNFKANIHSHLFAQDSKHRLNPFFGAEMYLARLDRLTRLLLGVLGSNCVSKRALRESMFLTLARDLRSHEDLRRRISNTCMWDDGCVSKAKRLQGFWEEAQYKRVKRSQGKKSATNEQLLQG